VAEDYTNTAQFCSLTCARRLVKHRYRARKHKAYVANVSPRLIHERDGWTCQLCLLPIDLAQHVPEPLAAVIDHVIPLARGGTQCAHFLCNSIKSDRVGSHAG
jgi:5-methylcytosine-specific restriction endonuclease McrA